MNLWTLVHFTAFIVYFFSVFYVIIKNPYAVTNWILAAIFSCFALWSACSFLLDNSFVTFADAQLIMKIQSVGWASFASFYLLFVLFLTNNKKLLSMPIFIIFILLLPVLFLNKNLNGEMLQCCTQVSYGVAGTWMDTPWPYIYFAFYTLVFLFSMQLLARHRNAVRSESERKMIDILFLSTTAVFTIGTVFSVIMNYLKIYNPVDANVVFLIFTGGFIYCAEKFELLSLTSHRNADRIMELVNEGIMIIDDDRKISIANRAAMEIFGFSPDHDTKESYAFIETLLKKSGVALKNTEITNSEIIFQDAAGTKKAVLISGRVLLKDNVNSGMIFTIRDISDTKKAELDLAFSVKELERSNEELENFAYVASHDLKEPLRMVYSYTQLIKKKFHDKLGKDGNDYIDIASDGAKRMTELIDGLLEYSRIRRSEESLTLVDLSGTVDSVKNILKYVIEDKKAVINVKGELPSVLADSTQMELLFRNIISNALKFAGSKPPVITITSARTESGYEFTITDNGIGIDMHYSEKIFQLFQQLNNKHEYEGSGMGLAICRKIVESYGGRIWIESEGPGEGSSFSFTLPAAPVQ